MYFNKIESDLLYLDSKYTMSNVQYKHFTQANNNNFNTKLFSM